MWKLNGLKSFSFNISENFSTTPRVKIQITIIVKVCSYAGPNIGNVDKLLALFISENFPSRTNINIPIIIKIKPACVIAASEPKFITSVSEGVRERY